MIAARTVYDTCLALAKKDQRGRAFNIDEYNKIAALVNMELYNYYIGRYESGVGITEALLRVKVRNETLALTAGQAWLPNLADRIVGNPTIVHPWGPITATASVDVVNNPNAKVKVTAPNHGLKDGAVVTCSGLSEHTITSEPIHFIDKNSFWVDVDFSADDTLTSASWMLDDYSYKDVDMVTEEELSAMWADANLRPTTHNPAAILDIDEPLWWVDGDVSLGVPLSGNAFITYNSCVGISFDLTPTNDATPPVSPLNLKTGDVIAIYGGTNGNGVAAGNINGYHRIVVIDLSDLYPNPSVFNVYMPDLPTASFTAPTFAYVRLPERKRINVYPTTIPAVSVSYLIKPATPFLDYYVNDTTYVITYLDKRQELTNFAAGNTYRDGTAGDDAIDIDSITEDWQWDEDMLPQIVYMMLQKMGINLENMTVAQIATQLQAKEESNV
jgi:hypothetical protein